MEIIIIICAVTAVLMVLAAVLIRRENKKIDLTEYDVYDECLPEGFDGARIVHISDFHNSLFGKNNERLISLISEQKPDYIFITGDLLDARRPKFNITDAFVRNIAGIAPIYYCTGNHESRVLSDLKKIEKRFRSCGIKCLRCSFANIKRNGSRVRIIGVDDPSFFKGCQDRKAKEEMMGERVSELTDPDSYNILLAHKPHLFSRYEEAGADLVFSGHAHGGQFRLPFNIPLFTPDEGLFPKYAQGVKESENTRMVISRGLGQSAIPFRLNNSPELVKVTLHSGKKK